MAITTNNSSTSGKIMANLLGKFAQSVAKNPKLVANMTALPDTFPNAPKGVNEALAFGNSGTQSATSATPSASTATSTLSDTVTDNTKSKNEMISALYSGQNKAPIDMAPYANESAYNTAQLLSNLKAQTNPTTEYLFGNTAENGNNGGGSGDGGSSAYAMNQALQDAYNQRANLLLQNYNSALANLLSGYNANTDAVNKSADNALREAYINRMLSQKNLGQMLSANGLNGGAAESTMAGLINNYGNSRNNIETERINALAELLSAYQTNQQKAQQSYNEALLSAMPTYSQILSTM